MTSEELVTLLVIILGLLTAVLYVGKGYLEWDTAQLKNELLRHRKSDKREEDNE